MSGSEPSWSLEGLSMPRRPAGVPDAEGEDHDARALLEANGHATATGELLVALDSGIGIFQAAAARTLGAVGAREAAEPLARLAGDTGAEETARVQAAFALARMGLPGGHEVLIELLAGNPEASPAPAQAAGALARLGDPRGLTLIRTALDSPNRVTAMVAAKQLGAFAALDGAGRDVEEAFARALERTEPAIAGEARAQLSTLGTDWSQRLLAGHPPPAAG